MTTGKTIALTRRTYAGKVMSLLFSVLSLLITRGEKANSFSVASIPDCSSHCWGLLLWPLQCPNRLRWAFAARSIFCPYLFFAHPWAHSFWVLLSSGNQPTFMLGPSLRQFEPQLSHLSNGNEPLLVARTETDLSFFQIFFNHHIYF